MAQDIGLPLDAQTRTTLVNGIRQVLRLGHERGEIRKRGNNDIERKKRVEEPEMNSYQKAPLQNEKNEKNSSKVGRLPAQYHISLSRKHFPRLDCSCYFVANNFPNDVTFCQKLAFSLQR